MKPFDLEAAKRGEPIQTRDGRKAHFIGVIPPEFRRTNRPFIAIAEGINETQYTTTGRYWNDNTTSPDDLFMAPRKQVRYLIVWRDSDGDVIADLCSDEMECNHYVDRLRDQGHTVLTYGQKVEWEE